MQFTIHSRYDENNQEYYFFSTDHCQGVHDKDYPKDQGFVPTTHYLPRSVVPRDSLPSGIVSNLQELLMIFYPGAKEIPNPNPAYQPPAYKP